MNRFLATVQDVVGRFNERFILSLASCEGCLVLDDELNVLPISRHTKGIVPFSAAAAASIEDDESGGALDVPLTESERALRDLKGRCVGVCV
jgi:N-acetyltransferase 10